MNVDKKSICIATCGRVISPVTSALKTFWNSFHTSEVQRPQTMFYKYIHVHVYSCHFCTFLSPLHLFLYIYFVVICLRALVSFMLEKHLILSFPVSN